MLYVSRMVYIICCFCLFLAFAFGLMPVSYAATYEGQWTKIILDRVNSSSIDVKGTATFGGPDLTPKTYNLPATITASRFAKLAKGALRGGAYGLIINGAMEAAGYNWDEILKNWVKTISNLWKLGPTCESTGYSCEYISTDNKCYGPNHTYIDTATFANCSTVGRCAAGYSEVYTTCEPKFTCSYTIGTSNYTIDRYGSICKKNLPSSVFPDSVIPASDQDIYDKGVKPNSVIMLPNIITGLPDVLNTPTSILNRSTNIVNIHWPEIVEVLNIVVNNLNTNINIQNILNQIINNTSPLTAEQQAELDQKNVIVPDLLAALEKLSLPTPTPLTPAEQAAITNITNIQNTANTNLTSNTTSTPATEIVIPTDCDLIPFVCNWLTWFKGWLTDEPEPIPDVIIPITDLSNFTPYPTSTAGSCPAPYQYSMFGSSYTLSFQPWCDFALSISFLVIASAWLFASYIVLRV